MMWSAGESTNGSELIQEAGVSIAPGSDTAERSYNSLTDPWKVFEPQP